MRVALVGAWRRGQGQALPLRRNGGEPTTSGVGEGLAPSRASDLIRALGLGLLMLGVQACASPSDSTDISSRAGIESPADPWAGPPSDAAPFRVRKLTQDAAGGGDATLSPDGRFFVTTSLRTGRMDIWLYDIEQAEWTQVTNEPGEDFEARFSPDGKRLVFTSTRSGTKDIWMLSLETLAEDGGAPRRLTTSAFEDEYPIFSPDGESVVYTGGPWGARDFRIVPTAGGASRKIGDARERPGGVGRVGACGFDASGESLVCHDYGLGTGNLMRLWLDGTSVPLTLGDAWDYKPSASGDGRFVAFSRALEGPSQIWLMPSAGGRARRLTSTADSDRWPTWSADGSRLFFHRLVDRGTAIEVLDRDTGETRVISIAGEVVGQAALHPEGTELAYCALDTHEVGEASDGGVKEGLHRLRIVDLTTPGSAPRDLAMEATEACWPRYFPDGRRLALAARAEPGSRWDVAVVDLPSAGAIARPRWITAGESGPGGMRWRGMDGPIDVSPDGRYLVFHADTLAFEANIYLADLESGEIEALTRDAWFDEAPAFTADGRGVLFMSTRGGDWTWGLFRLDLEERSLDLFAGPDWVQKNYVRPGPSGVRYWAQATDQGMEQIVEQRQPGAEPTVVVAAAEGASGILGARWPSGSADGRLLAYTRIEHRVEYWLVENPAGPGSPIYDPDHTPTIRLASRAPGSERATASDVGSAGGAGASSNRNVHSAPTPPGGLGAVPPAAGASAGGTSATGTSAAGASAADPSRETLLFDRPAISPVDTFHR